MDTTWFFKQAFHRARREISRQNWFWSQSPETEFSFCDFEQYALSCVTNTSISNGSNIKPMFLTKTQTNPSLSFSEGRGTEHHGWHRQRERTRILWFFFFSPSFFLHTLIYLQQWKLLLSPPPPFNLQGWDLCNSNTLKWFAVKKLIYTHIFCMLPLSHAISKLY